MNATTGPPGRAATPAGTSGTTAPAATPQQRMRAIVQAGYGSADVSEGARLASQELWKTAAA